MARELPTRLPRGIGRGKYGTLISPWIRFLMPQFSYRARNAQGALVEGVLNVTDRAVAIRQIEQQNWAAGDRWQACRAGCGTDADSKDSARAIAYFYRAACASAAGGNDPR